MQDYPWWNETQRELMADAEKLMDEIIIPMAEKCAYKKEFPWEAIKVISKKGWFGATVPEEYGGHQNEWGVTGACILCEALSRAGALVWPVVTSLIGSTQQILHDGTEEQKRRWLPKLASGEFLGAISMTEPYAGSDIASIETIGILKDDHYIVNGRKRFQTNAGAADLYMTYVKTSEDPQDRKQYKHLTGLIIEKGMPGFSLERVNELGGFPGIYNAYLSFDNVKVPVENVIGGEGNGWSVMTSALNMERALAAACFLGGMRESIRYARMHLERRVQFGKTTGSITTNQFKLSEMYMNYQLSRLLVYYLAYAADSGHEVPVEAASAKLFCSEVAFQIAYESVQCMGGNGALQIYPVERIMRNVKLNQIAGGTSEIQKLLIYRLGNRSLANDLQAPVRMIDSEINFPLPFGKKQQKKSVDNEMDVLKVLAENYRVNPGLHMTIDDMRQFLEVDEEGLLKYLEQLEDKGLASQLINRKGKVELVKATLSGIKEANTLEHYKHIPSWVNFEDMF